MHFCVLSQFFFQICYLENCGQGHGFESVPLSGEYDFLFDGNSNVCPIYHHLQDIHKSNNFSRFKVKVTKEKNRTCTI